VPLASFDTRDFVSPDYMSDGVLLAGFARPRFTLQQVLFSLVPRQIPRRQLADFDPKKTLPLR